MLDIFDIILFCSDFNFNSGRHNLRVFQKTRVCTTVSLLRCLQKIRTYVQINLNCVSLFLPVLAKKMEVKDIKPRWLSAKDIAIRDDTPFKKDAGEKIAGVGRNPLSWEPFSDHDSGMIEDKWQELKRKPSANPRVLPVSGDGLFEANVKDHEFYPIYWKCKTFEIRRFGASLHLEEYGSYRKDLGSILANFIYKLSLRVDF